MKSAEILRPTLVAPPNFSATYDANGNRIDVSDGPHSVYGIAASNQYKSDWTGVFQYDNNANLTWRAGWNFKYDAQNRLVALDNNSTNVHIRQHYDGLNRVVARDSNGDITTNVWDNWDLLEERFSSDAIRRRYLHGAGTNEIVGSFDGPSFAAAFYFYDGRGNTTHLTNSSNTVIERYTYLVSGQPSYFDGNIGRSSSSVDNRFLFKGALYLPAPANTARP